MKYTAYCFLLIYDGYSVHLFGPIKYAYLPETMRHDELVAANGLFQTSTSLAILTGMMTAGILTQLYFSEYWLATVTIVVAILGYLSARQIPKLKFMHLIYPSIGILLVRALNYSSTCIICPYCFYHFR